MEDRTCRRCGKEGHIAIRCAQQLDNDVVQRTAPIAIRAPITRVVIRLSRELQPRSMVGLTRAATNNQQMASAPTMATMPTMTVEGMQIQSVSPTSIELTGTIVPVNIRIMQPWENRRRGAQDETLVHVNLYKAKISRRYTIEGKCFIRRSEFSSAGDSSQAHPSASAYVSIMAPNIYNTLVCLQLNNDSYILFWSWEEFRCHVHIIPMDEFVYSAHYGVWETATHLRSYFVPPIEPPANEIAEDEAVGMSDEDEAMSDDDDILVEEELLVPAPAAALNLENEAAAIEPNMEVRDDDNLPIEDEAVQQQQNVVEVNAVQLDEAVELNRSIQISGDEAGEADDELLDEFGEPLPDSPTQSNRDEAAALAQVNEQNQIEGGDEAILAAFIRLFTQCMDEANGNFCQLESLRRSIDDVDVLEHDPDVPMTLHRVARTEATARAALEEKIREARARLDLQLLMAGYEAYWDAFGAYISWAAVIETAIQGTLDGVHPQLDSWIESLVIDSMLDPENETHVRIIHGMWSILKVEFLGMCSKMKNTFDDLTVEASNN